MKVLIVTNMYPTPGYPSFGIFVHQQVESLREKGIDIDVFSVDGKKNKLNYLWGFPRFWAQLLTHRYDLIHAHYVFSGFIARAQFLYPVVLTHHGFEVFKTWQRFPSRLITPFVNKVIVVSEEMKTKLKCKRAEVIPCGINLDFFKPISKQEARKKLNLPIDKKLICWVGQHTRPEKRYDIVQAAIAVAKKKDPDIELVLVSGKPPETVPVYMSACDVLFLVSDGEGSPMVIKEAMACNLPVVSVPVGDVPQVIGNTEGCYLCSQEPEDVAQKLALALKWGKRTNGRNNISHLDLKVISQSIITVYENLLRKKDKGAPESVTKQKKLGPNQVK